MSLRARLLAEARVRRDAAADTAPAGGRRPATSSGSAERGLRKRLASPPDAAPVAKRPTPKAATPGTKKSPQDQESPPIAPAAKFPGPTPTVAPASLAAFLGVAGESRETHLRRHDGGRRDCGRCRFYMWGAAWAKAYGQEVWPPVQSAGKRKAVDMSGAAGEAAVGAVVGAGASAAARGPAAGKRARREATQWLAERPARWPGPWGLGCAFCAAFVEKLREADARTTLARFGTKWARFEVRTRCLQASHIRQHLGYELHRLATEAYFRPDAPVRVLLQSDDEADLLAGAVPQLADWLRAFRAARTPASFASVAETLRTEHYIRGIRARAVQRRALHAQVAIMAEVVRRRQRRWIRDAASITIALDDKGPHRLIRFKADCLSNLSALDCAKATEATPAGGESAGVGDAVDIGEAAGETAFRNGSVFPHEGACAGVLGLFRPHHDAEVEDFDEDYSMKMCESIVGAIRDFCTPWAEPRDEALLAHFLNSVRVYMADGAASVQKCGQLLRRSCPNLVVLARDPAHAVRIACRDPLHTEERFAEQWERIFNKKTAIIPEIQHSDQLRARLVACQRRVLQVDGGQGGGLTSILKHFSFVKTRFESFVGPRRKYICLLQAIVMLLCSLAGDKRQAKARRDEAEAALDAITPADVFACGLAADFSEVCLSYIRKLDVSNHDPALGTADKREFLNTLDELFLQGNIFVAPDAGEAAAPSAAAGEPAAILGGVRAKTLTQIAMEQMEPMRVFYYGTKTKVLWSRTARADAQAALTSMQDVVKATQSRVEADLYERDTLMLLEVFNLAEWAAARVLIRDACAAKKARGQQRHNRLVRKLRQLAKKLGEEDAPAIGEFDLILPRALRLRRRLASPPGESSDATLDNRRIWAAFLAPALRARHPRLTRLIRFYLSVLDGTGLLERGLGSATGLSSKHLGPLHESGKTLADLLCVYLDGPDDESEVAARGGGDGELFLTAFSRECAEEWVARHGRRFSCTQKPRKNKGVKRTGWRLAGSDRAVQTGQQKATSLRALARDGQSATTMFGEPAAAFHHDAQRPAPDNLKRFNRLTKDRRQAKRHQTTAPAAPPQPQLRPGGTLAQSATKSAARAGRRISLEARLSADRAVIFVLGSPLRADMAAHFVVRASPAGVDVVVVPHVTDLVIETLGERDLLVWLAVVAGGKTVIARADVQQGTTAASPACLRHQAATRLSALRLNIASAFAEAHPRLVSGLQAYAASPQSKWKVSVGDGGRAGESVMVTTLADFQSVLRRARRLAPARGDHGSYCRPCA